MIIKDTYCMRCDTRRENEIVPSCDWVDGILDCETCGKPTRHRVVCNGGVKLKPYVTSYDGRQWSRDEVQVVGSSVTDGDGNAVTERDGTDTASIAQRRSAARRDERRDHLSWQRKKRDGQSTIYSK